jgi:xylulokinase
VAARDDRYVLAVDLGTGGPKVGFVSVTGRVAWKDHVPLATRFLEGGGAVQDAEEWWQVITDAARRGLASGAVDAATVVAVCCTGQWASTVPVDAAGRPVGDCVMWMDTRGGRYSHAVVGGPVAGLNPRAAATWVRHTAGVPSPSGADPLGHRLFLERDEPAIARAARWMLEPVDYLSMRFTGVAAASHASMTGSWLTDNRQLDRLEYDPVLVRLAGIDASKLPPLRPTGSVVGTVLPEVAADIGLPADVQVVTGHPDLHSATVGSGAIDDFAAHMAISTTSWIGAPVPFKRTDAIRQIATVPGLGLGRAGYLIANNHETAGLCLQWLRDNVMTDADGGYDDLTALAAGVPAGSGGVIFTPWLAGERSPVSDKNARAGFHNLSLQSTRADMVRAVLEGVAYNNRWLLDAVDRFAKRRLDPIRIVGGGAASDLWCAIHADVLDRTIERVVEPLHANLRGAALYAGLAIGDVRRDEIRSLVPVETTFVPDRGNQAEYQRLYDEFPKLYKAQKSMFRRLNGRRR